VSAPARYAAATLPTAAPGPALVPVAGDRAPRIHVSPGPQKPVNVHRLFFTLWYLSLTLFAGAAWVQVLSFDAYMTLTVLGGLFAALGGFGVVIHALWQPSERKLRHALAAGAALALSLASAGPLRHVSTQMFATSRVARLQPLAEALARDAAIRNVGVAGEDQVRLNGFQGPWQGDGGWLEGSSPAPSATLSEILARDGIAYAELRAYADALRRAGMGEAERSGGRVTFTYAYNLKLLYVPTGVSLPDPRRLVDRRSRWRTEPLGGGWYLLQP
jgi:hypothetical protein